MLSEAGDYRLKNQTLPPRQAVPYRIIQYHGWNGNFRGYFLRKYNFFTFPKFVKYLDDIRFRDSFERKKYPFRQHLCENTCFRENMWTRANARESVQNQLFLKNCKLFSRHLSRKQMDLGDFRKNLREMDVLTKTEWYIGRYLSAQGPQSTCTLHSHVWSTYV